MRESGNFSFDNPENIEQFGPLPAGFNQDLAMANLIKDDNGPKLYRAFKALKSQFRSTWTKYVIDKSGDNDMDMIDRVCRHVWAERCQAKAKKKKLMCTDVPADCPASFVPLEKVTFAAFWDHPILKRAMSSLAADTDERIPHSESIVGSVMNCAEQRALKKQKSSHNNSNTNNNNEVMMQKNQIKKEQLAVSKKQFEELQLHNKIQKAALFKDTNPVLHNKLIMKLLDQEGIDEMDDNNNNSSSSNNNNNN